MRLRSLLFLLPAFIIMACGPGKQAPPQAAEKTPADTLTSKKRSTEQENAWRELVYAYEKSGEIQKIMAKNGFHLECMVCEDLACVFAVSVDEKGQLLSCSIRENKVFCKYLFPDAAAEQLLASFTAFLRSKTFPAPLRNKVIIDEVGFHSKC